jgi:hypothetical protein
VTLAPGRYCLATCYCGECDHWKPPPAPRTGVAPVIDKRINKTWTEREVSTWIDDM